MANSAGKLAIAVGGGPAPGINSVIAAASIRAALKGYEVIGIEQGFRWLMKGDISHVMPLSIETVSRIHFRGGSVLGTARDNPTKDPDHVENVVRSLKKLGVDKLITIGGDDTAFSAMTIEQRAGDGLKVVHVPKTIDNDLDLPRTQHTFGFQTARHVGAGLVKNIMIDAKTTARWFVVISMGRKAGHLALGIGKAAGATVTVIPEEFPGGTIQLDHVVDIIAGTIIKRLSEGRADGVAVLAEGLMERMDPNEFDALKTVQRDAHGHIRLSDLQFGPILKERLNQRLSQFGLDANVATKEIGYELRCSEPIPYDMEYTRDLGFCAAQFIINGGSAAMVVIDAGRFKPLYFKDMLDPVTKRTRIRMVDVGSEYYHIARRYMLRLNRTDFEDEHAIARYARTCGITPNAFRDNFQYLIEKDLLNRIRDDRLRKKKKPSVEDVMTPF